MPRSAAHCLVGVGMTFSPRPLGLSGWLTSSSIACPAACNARSDGTANCGLPKKTTRILPFSIFHKPLHLARNQAPFERTDTVQEIQAVQVIDLMAETAGQ